MLLVLVKFDELLLVKIVLAERKCGIDSARGNTIVEDVTRTRRRVVNIRLTRMARLNITVGKY